MLCKFFFKSRVNTDNLKYLFKSRINVKLLKYLFMYLFRSCFQLRWQRVPGEALTRAVDWCWPPWSSSPCWSYSRPSLQALPQWTANLPVPVLEGTPWGTEIPLWIETDDTVYIKNKDFLHQLYQFCLWMFLKGSDNCGECE